MRDDFSAATRELLAKRVGFVCSNPECRQPTSGPQADPAGTVNIGVAAHISAASPGGPRYKADLSPKQRADSCNGIWLCQTCAKLIDSDDHRFSRPALEGWKRAAERAAAIALSQGRRPTSASQPNFAKIERLLPALLEEMREDLHNNPTTREFVLLKRAWSYNSRGPYLAYYFDDHQDLEGKLQVLTNFSLVREITYNNVRRFVFEEEFVDYLIGL
ncbi:MAG: hypothetical protein H8K07_11265 [Nitrospira sp.]|jgi:hypothetical protein|nr:hypothetical protein [Nitrospira sp.]MDI3463996.1 hypothetical protein [Nitrospira sp.]